mmetsp:Transcript_16579/g.24552  ORF Transcript_16579/g.24552 Transcript_16579/m.24552 type:complete len:90 (+) Transcript_16579:179-448(+)
MEFYLEDYAHPTKLPNKFLSNPKIKSSILINGKIFEIDSALLKAGLLQGKVEAASIQLLPEHTMKRPTIPLRNNAAVCVQITFVGLLFY